LWGVTELSGVLQGFWHFVALSGSTLLQGGTPCPGLRHIVQRVDIQKQLAHVLSGVLGDYR
jgi:hypothetical protein